MKKIALMTTTLSILFAQTFSSIPRTEEAFITNLPSNEPKYIFIDESTSLIWQNSRYLRKTKSYKRAVKYCNNLKLEGYRWRLPTLSELTTLLEGGLRKSLKSDLRFTASSSYMAADTPFWDTTLHYAFHYRQQRTLLLKKSSRKHYVRCVTSLGN